MTRTKDTREAIARALRSNSYGKKWDDAPFNPEEDSGDAAWLRAADAALTALESAPQAGGDVRELLKEALDALELFIPSPMCRDCADENGTCPNSRSEARPCDPHEAAEWARGVRDRASVALTATPAQPTRESDKVECLIWSGEHNAYWRPDGAGYTTRIRDAGRYSLEDAKKRTNHCGPEKRIEIEPIAAQPTPERGG